MMSKSPARIGLPHSLANLTLALCALAMVLAVVVPIAYSPSAAATNSAPDQSFDLTANNNASGPWSDGATIWVANPWGVTIYAYDLATGARQSNRDIHTLPNTGPESLWSDGATIWVTDLWDEKIYAYDLATGARQPNSDINSLHDAGNTSPAGLWSDGATIWVTDSWDDKIYAYDLATGARQPDLDFDTLIAAGNRSPKGIWSNGTTMWVADNIQNRIYAYNMPPNASLQSLELTGIDIEFSIGRLNYTAQVPSTTTSTTVAATAASADATVDITPNDADDGTNGHQISLSPGANTITIAVTNGTATKTYAAVITRDNSQRVNPQIGGI